jgi:hypothetical protein
LISQIKGIYDEKETTYDELMAFAISIQNKNNFLVGEDGDSKEKKIIDGAINNLFNGLESFYKIETAAAEAAEKLESGEITAKEKAAAEAAEEEAAAAKKVKDVEVEENLDIINKYYNRNGELKIYNDEVKVNEGETILYIPDLKRTLNKNILLIANTLNFYKQSFKNRISNELQDEVPDTQQLLLLNENFVDYTKLKDPILGGGIKGGEQKGGAPRKPRGKGIKVDIGAVGKAMRESSCGENIKLADIDREGQATAMFYHFNGYVTVENGIVTEAGADKATPFFEYLCNKYLVSIIGQEYRQLLPGALPAAPTAAPTAAQQFLNACRNPDQAQLRDGISVDKKGFYYNELVVFLNSIRLIQPYYLQIINRIILYIYTRRKESIPADLVKLKKNLRDAQTKLQEFNTEALAGAPATRDRQKILQGAVKKALGELRAESKKHHNHEVIPTLLDRITTDITGLITAIDKKINKIMHALNIVINIIYDTKNDYLGVKTDFSVQGELVDGLVASVATIKPSEFELQDAFHNFIQIERPSPYEQIINKVFISKKGLQIILKETIIGLATLKTQDESELPEFPEGEQYNDFNPTPVEQAALEKAAAKAKEAAAATAAAKAKEAAAATAAAVAGRAAAAAGAAAGEAAGEAARIQAPPGFEILTSLEILKLHIHRFSNAYIQAYIKNCFRFERTKDMFELKFKFNIDTGLGDAPLQLFTGPTTELIEGTIVQEYIDQYKEDNQEVANLIRRQ